MPELVQGGRLKIYCVFTLAGSSPAPTTQMNVVTFSNVLEEHYIIPWYERYNIEFYDVIRRRYIVNNWWKLFTIHLKDKKLLKG